MLLLVLLRLGGGAGARGDAGGGHHQLGLGAGSLDEAIHPALEAEAVHDDDLGRRQCLRIGRGGLVDVAVAIGADDGGDGHPVAAHFLHEIAGWRRRQPPAVWPKGLRPGHRPRPMRCRKMRREWWPWRPRARDVWRASGLPFRLQMASGQQSATAPHPRVRTRRRRHRRSRLGRWTGPRACRSCRTRAGR